MILVFSKQAEKAYKRLSLILQKKADKQFSHLLVNYRYPSLRTKRMGGSDVFEGRIDIHYRFTFQVEGEEIYIHTIGPHDEGLGKR